MKPPRTGGLTGSSRQYDPARTTTEGGTVPTFMDYHDDLKLPAEAVEAIRQGAVAREVDAFGVRQVELFHNPQGKVYCLLEAPDADAVRRHHEALGVDCGDVHEVASLT
ncbi:MAG: nickel-binding protein [Actinomycetes bacterium]